MNLDQLTEENKKAMIVEERYTFFQIENKLRMICAEGMEALRTKITKDADIMRKIQTMAESARRDVAAMEPRIDRALLMGSRIDKMSSDVTGLETSIRI